MKKDTNKIKPQKQPTAFELNDIYGYVQLSPTNKSNLDWHNTTNTLIAKGEIAGFELQLDKHFDLDKKYIW